MPLGINRLQGFLKRVKSRGKRAVEAPVGLPTVVTLSPDVRATLNDDGVVFLEIRSGTVFRSNRVGAAIWKGLMDSQDLVSIASRIACEHAVSVERVSQDAACFLAQLERSGFLVRQPGT